MAPTIAYTTQLYYPQSGGQNGDQIDKSYLSLKWPRELQQIPELVVTKNINPQLQFCCKLVYLVLNNNFDSNGRIKATVERMRTRASVEMVLEVHYLEMRRINARPGTKKKYCVRSVVEEEMCNNLMQISLQIALFIQQGTCLVQEMSSCSCFECEQHNAAEAIFGFQKN